MDFVFSSHLTSEARKKYSIGYGSLSCLQYSNTACKDLIHTYLHIIKSIDQHITYLLVCFILLS